MIAATYSCRIPDIHQTFIIKELWRWSVIISMVQWYTDTEPGPDREPLASPKLLWL